MDHQRYALSGRAQQLQQSRRSTLGGRTGPNGGGNIHSQPNAVPALLKSTKDDFGEDYVAAQRRNRFIRAGGASSATGRARSEVAEILSNGSARMSHSYHHRRDGSYDVDDRRPMNTVRASASYYDRPRSSFEPASQPTRAAPRIVRNREDDWQAVERRHQYSSEDDIDEEDYDSGDIDEELEMYNSRAKNVAAYGRGPHHTRSSRTGHEFSENDVYYFASIQLSPSKARQIIMTNPPAPDFWNLNSIEKTAYLYYYCLYKKYFMPVKKFHNVFNREFFKYTAAGDRDVDALAKICKHTRDEFDLIRQQKNQLAYDRSRQHLFSDDRATPDSRATSYCEQLEDSDLTSLDSGVKEPLLFPKGHTLAKFGPGGKMLYLNSNSMSTLRVFDVKERIHDRAELRNIKAMENFKGPLIYGETPSHTPILFIERQIAKIKQSEIYIQNPSSSDVNDVLLIWELLLMLIRQQGNVTGPDLARLLTGNYSFSSQPASSKPTRGRPDKEFLYASDGSRNESPMFPIRDERKADSRAVDRYTTFLLTGYIDEAIDSAISDGLFFDALILAHRMFGNNKEKIEQIESRLLAYRDPQHPALTLLSVASQMPVPILSNMSAADDASSWRAHIAVVLANLNTDTAMYTVHQLGLALSRKEFNAAADFCFLVVNLLTQHDCFAPVNVENEDEEPYRRYITLINASLPDDEYYSTKTRYGWSIIDFQATEIYDFALKMSQRPIVGGLSASNEYQKCRLEYAQMLAEYGGAATSAFKYCSSIAGCIWDRAFQQDPDMLNSLCDLADMLYYAANQTPAELQWISGLRQTVFQKISNERNPLTPTIGTEAASYTEIGNHSIPDSRLIIPPTGVIGFGTSTPITNRSAEGEEEGHHSFIPAAAAAVTEHLHHLLPTSLASHQPILPTTVPHESHSILPPTSISSGPPPPLPPPQPIQHQASIESVPSQFDYVPPQIPQQPSSPAHSVTSVATFGYQTEDHTQPPSAKHSIDHGRTFEKPPPIQTTFSRERTLSQSSVNSLPSPQRSSFAPHNYGQQPQSIPETHESYQPLPQKEHPSVPEVKPANLVQQEPPQPAQMQQQPQAQKKPQQAKGGGITGYLKKQLVKMIPSGDEMKLPDDSKSNIYYDEKLGRWVGEGIEEPTAVPPPPLGMPAAMDAGGPTVASMPTLPSAAPSSTAPSQVTAPTGGRRRPGANRYAAVPFAASTEASSTPAISPEGFGMPLAATSTSPLPPTFGFIPTTTLDDNDDESANPFSSGPAEPLASSN